MLLGLTMLLVFGATLIGIMVDHRIITGAPVWLKPAKFAISIAIYSFTFVWMLGFVKNYPRLTRWTANITAISFAIEMLVIVIQAVRGTTSHFNISTKLDFFLWSIMGSFIVIVWIMNLLLAILLMCQRLPDRAFAWSLYLGVLITAYGMALSFLMTTRPTPEQQAIIASGHSPKTFGAHSVGVADGGKGLPILGWSTEGGDLRIAHFVGLHALQVLPFLSWLLLRLRRTAILNEHKRLSLILTSGFAYFSMVSLLAWQALRGQSIINPDAITISTALLIALISGVLASVTLAKPAKSL